MYDSICSFFFYRTDLLPEKPTDLISTKSASTYLEITWKNPQNTGVKLGTNNSNPLTRYRLIVVKDTVIVFNKTWEKADIKPYNVTNLVPYTTYVVNVTAGNSAGFGRSSTAKFRTVADGEFTSFFVYSFWLLFR